MKGRDLLWESVRQTLVRVLIVDLNNFSRYPTMSVGYAAAILRRQGMEVEVFSPLSVGVPSYPRKTRPKPWGLIDHGLRYWSGTTRSQTIRKLRQELVHRVRPTNDDATRKIIVGAEEAMTRGADVVLVSAYTMYFDVCSELCKIAAREGIPIAIGGPYFSQPEIIEEWLTIPGLTALMGGELESYVTELVKGLAEGRDVTPLAGVSCPGKPAAGAAPPVIDLDQIPFPDYSDFPWNSYPNRIIPMLAGRGCGWGVCTFCSDVVTSSGRGFRSRSAQNVLEEMRHQHEQHDSRLFYFLDLKLNSDSSVWKALAEQTQSIVPGAAWTASVHVGLGEKEGLSYEELKVARQSGLVRMTTGLESGSTQVLAAMAKGTDPEVTSRFLRDAHQAGITMRLTTIIGYPGEEPDDVLATAKFLERHQEYVDRIVLSPFALQLGTPFQRRFATRPERFPAISEATLNLRTATFDHVNSTFHGIHHRKAAFKLLKVIHRINRKPHTRYSREFDGVM